MTDGGRVLCIGDLVADVTVTSRGPIVAGSDTPGVVELSCGGSAANVAVWVATCGGTARFVGVVGDDRLGEHLVGEIGDHGVHLDVLRRRGARTRAIAALVTAPDREPDRPGADDGAGAGASGEAAAAGEAGDRSMVSAIDAATDLRVAEVSEDWFDGVDRLHLTAYTWFRADGPALWDRLTSIARERSIPWSVDPSSAEMIRRTGRVEELAAAMSGADVVFANRDEAAVLTGALDPAIAAGRLARGETTGVVTVGAAGVHVAPAGSAAFHLPAGPAEVVNTLGCGDAFAAGFLTARSRGACVRASARLAIETAARAAELASAVPTPPGRGRPHAG
ncbi:carbohydrate kinase family protein [Ilumatobacter sp.]|uniref:carbohydrate kinase family protein n=1 Tax=Ilumatobacter sp. TaxID=1967498 RepID=UPI003B5237BA